MARQDVAKTSIREALAEGFNELLSDADALSAVKLWDERYARSKPNALIEYVNEVAATLMLPTRQRHEIRMALYRALLARGIDPTRLSGGGAATAASSTDAAPRTVTPGGFDSGQPPSAAFRVFRAVALGVFQGISASASEGPVLFVAAIKVHARSHGLTDSGRHALEAWAAGNDDDGYFRKLSAAEYPRVAHLMYVAACEAIGPVLADRVFSQAIGRAELMQEALEFSPRGLL